MKTLYNFLKSASSPLTTRPFLLGVMLLCSLMAQAQFTQVTPAAAIGLPGSAQSSVEWADYDSDGDLDFIFSGATSSAVFQTQIWKNTAGNFADVTATAAPGLTGLYRGAIDWGDYDNDGDLDFVITGISGSSGSRTIKHAEIWRNGTTGTKGIFVNVTSTLADGLPGVDFGNATWGDCDSDGDLDLLVTGLVDVGASSIGFTAAIWKNGTTGTRGNFTDVTATVASGLSAPSGLLGAGTNSWMDFDSDGDLDFVIAGGQRNTQFWQNTDGNFRNITAGVASDLPFFNAVSMDWGDYDRDGDADLVFSGYEWNLGSRVTQIWRNDWETSGRFVNATSMLIQDPEPTFAGIADGCVRWVDFDNDGVLDLFVSGQGNSVSVTKLYRSTLGNFFNDVTAAVSPGFPAMNNASAAWGDYDYDGDQDLVLIGANAQGARLAQIWKNDAPGSNAMPSTPANLVSTHDHITGRTTLGWGASADDSWSQTITYNLRLGTSSGGNEAVPSHANSVGMRSLVNPGNAGYRRSVTLNGLPAGNYYWSVQAVDNAFLGSQFGAEKTFTIKQTQTITLAASAEVFYGKADYHPATSTNPGVPVTYTSSNPLVATIVDGKIHIVGVGTTTITAEQAEDVNFYPAISKSQTLTVAPRPVTIAADARTSVYGDAEPALTFQITSGSLVGSDAFTGTLERDAGNDPGSYAIRQGTLALNANYQLTYTGADLTIAKRPVTVKADSYFAYYGDPDPEFTYQVVSGSLVGSDAFSGQVQRDPGENVGTYAIRKGSLALNSNYDLTFIEDVFSLFQMDVVITVDAKSKVYGEPDPELTYRITSGNLVGSDQFTGHLSRTPGDDAGTYTIERGSLALSDNYDFNFVGADFQIDKRPLIVTAHTQTKVYGTPDPELTFTLTGSLAAGDEFTGTLERAPGNNAGVYAITVGTLTAGSNYTLTYSGADLTISKMALVIKVLDKSKPYGDADPFFGFDHEITSGWLSSGDVLSGSKKREAGEDIGEYAITEGNTPFTAGPNYTITVVPGTFKIEKRPIGITADGLAKVYGEADPELTYRITAGNLVGSDAITGELLRTAGENVGQYAIEQNTLSAGSNYSITFEPATLIINGRSLTVTADALTKIYGEAEPDLTYRVTSGSLIGLDALEGSLNRLSGENRGTYAITQGSLTAGNNYTITYVPADLTISRREISIRVDDLNKTYGDADPALTYTITSGTLVGGDQLSGTPIRADGQDAGEYHIDGDQVSGGSNYLIYNTPGKFTITPKAVTVTADNKSKEYGDTDPALTYSITNGKTLVNGDAFIGTLSRAAGEAPGVYAISQHSLSLSSNYNLTFVPAELRIAHRALTVAAGAKSKIYGEADPELTYAITSGSLLAGHTLSGSVKRDAGEHAGEYLIHEATPFAVNSNYAITFVPSKLTVTPRSLTITAEEESKVYGEADPEFTYTTAGTLLNGDMLTGSLARTAGEQVGQYAINLGSLTAGNNYSIILEPSALIINGKLLTVTAHAMGKTYGDADPEFTYSISAGSLVAGDSFNGSLSRASGENAGDYAITQNTLTAGNNYLLTVMPATFSIGKAPLTIKADDKSRNYGAVNPEFTASYSGFKNGDTFANLTKQPQLSTVAIQSSALGNYPIVVTGAESDNYSISYVNGTLMVKLGIAGGATNIVTPNGDGVNDTWMVKDIEQYPDNEVRIFDRSGRIIFRKKGYANDWDGTSEGRQLTADTYYYVVELGSGREQIKGFITLVRKVN